jgi:hypothetical protein
VQTNLREGVERLDEATIQHAIRELEDLKYLGQVPGRLCIARQILLAFTCDANDV